MKRNVLLQCVLFICAVLTIASVVSAESVLIQPTSCVKSNSNCELDDVVTQNAVEESQTGHNSEVRFIRTYHYNDSLPFFTNVSEILSVMAYVDRFETGPASPIYLQVVRPSDSGYALCTLGSKVVEDNAYDICNATSIVKNSSFPWSDAKNLSVVYNTQALGASKHMKLDHAYVNITYSDMFGPIIALGNPVNGTAYNASNVTFFFTPNDTTSGIANCSVVVDGAIGGTRSSIVEGQANNISTTLADGMHLWTVNCTDTSSNKNTGTNFTVKTVYVDLNPPSIMLNSPPNNSIIVSNITVFNFTATDSVSSVMSCSLLINGITNQTNTSVTNNTPTIFSAALAHGTYNWSVRCNDSVGNTNMSLTNVFSSNRAPVLSAVSAFPNPLKGGNNITITAFGANDPNNDTLSMFCGATEISNSSNTICTGGTVVGASPSYSLSCTFSTPTDSYAHIIYCRVYDNESYSTARSAVYVTDIASPNISGVKPVAGSLYNASQTVEISANVTDNVAVSAVLANITLPNGTIAQIALNQVGSTNKYNSSFTIPSLHGLYIVRYVANDTVGNVNSSVTSNFTGNDVTPPSITLVSVAGDAAAPYFDTVNDGYTSVIVNGESGMLCRISSLDTSYSLMSNGCSVNGTYALCLVSTPVQGGQYAYVSCMDSWGNEQTAVNNLDVFFVVDYTAPLTGDDATSAVHLPGYNVTITESDNVDNDPDTFYCTDFTNNCTPSIATNNSDNVQFSTRGTNYLRYYSIDDAGNSQAVVSREVRINQLPVFSSVSDNAVIIKGGSFINVTSVSSSGDVNQSVRLFVCRTEFANTSGCSNSTNTYCLANGNANVSCAFAAENDSAEHFWHAFVYDELNESAVANPRSGSYVTDSIFPSIVVSSPINTTLSQNSTTVEVVLNEAGDSAFFCLDSCASNVTMDKVSSTLWTKSLANLSNGQHVLRIYANDTVGNLANVTRVFAVDTTLQDVTPPFITVRSPVNGTYYANQSLMFNITSDESLSFAEYSLNGSAFTALNRSSATNWNAISILGEGYHNIVFRGNDTSGNRNQGNSSIVHFFVDITAPRNGTIGYLPASPNDIFNITCFSTWTDNVALNYGFVEYNVSGSFVNSTNVSFSGTSGNLSVVFSANPSLGNVGCRFYMYDMAGNLNRTGILAVPVSDVTAPGIWNLSYTPNTTADLDPGTIVNVTADVTDNRNISSVLLMYKLSNETNYTAASMTYLSGNRYNSFFNATEGNWTFYINATDAGNNSNAIFGIALSVLYDETWINTTTIPGVKNVSLANRSGNGALGNLTIINTGDFDINYTLNATSSGNRVTLNNTRFTSSVLRIARNSSQTISVEANTSDLMPGIYNYSIFIEARRNPIVGTSNLSFQLNVQNVAGPYLDVRVDSFDSQVMLGDYTNLVSSVTNIGTLDAHNVSLLWSVPAGWTITSGTVAKAFDVLSPGLTVINNATFLVSGNTGNFVVGASANSTDGLIENISRTVEVREVPVRVVTESVSQPIYTVGGSSVVPVAYSIDVKLSSHAFAQPGESVSFPVGVANPNSGILTNVTLVVVGYPSVLVSMDAPIVKDISYNETKYFIINLAVPKYMPSGNHSLAVRVIGDLKAGSFVYRNVTSYGSIVLVVNSSDEIEVNESVADLWNTLVEVSAQDVDSYKMKNLLEEARGAAASGNINLAGSLLSDILKMRDEIGVADSLLDDIRSRLADAEFNGIDVPESQRLYKLTLAAFQREDYETAVERGKATLLAFAEESSGKVNYQRFVQNYWWAVLFVCLISAVVAISLHRRLSFVLLNRTLESLLMKESSAMELMDKAKKDYSGGKVSRSDYCSTVRRCSAVLANIKRQRKKLLVRFAKAMSFGDISRNFAHEDSRVLSRLEDLRKKHKGGSAVSKKKYDHDIFVLQEFRAEMKRSLDITKSMASRQKKSWLHIMPIVRHALNEIALVPEELFGNIGNSVVSRSSTSSRKLQNSKSKGFGSRVLSVLSHFSKALNPIARYRSYPQKTFGIYNYQHIGRTWDPDVSGKRVYVARKIISAVMPLVVFLAMIFVATFAAFSGMLNIGVGAFSINFAALDSNPDSSSVSGTYISAYYAMESAKREVEEMQRLGFGVTHASDIMGEVSADFDHDNYASAELKAKSVVTIKKNAVLVDSEIETVRKLLVEKPIDVDISQARELFVNAVIAFENENYSMAKELLQAAVDSANEAERNSKVRR